MLVTVTPQIAGIYGAIALVVGKMKFEDVIIILVWGGPTLLGTTIFIANQVVRYCAGMNEAESLNLEIQQNSSTEPNWIELAKISLDEFKNRRELEWKLAFGFWTAVASFTYYYTSNDRPEALCSKILGLFYVLIGTFHVFGIFLVQEGHAKNKSYLHYYLDKASCEQINVARKPSVRKKCFEGIKWKWTIVQILTTFLFLTMSWYLVCSVPVRKS